jgi:hypothetical protein
MGTLSSSFQLLLTGPLWQSAQPTTPRIDPLAITACAQALVSLADRTRLSLYLTDPVAVGAALGRQSDAAPVDCSIRDIDANSVWSQLDIRKLFRCARSPSLIHRITRCPHPRFFHSTAILYGHCGLATWTAPANTIVCAHNTSVIVHQRFVNASPTSLQSRSPSPCAIDVVRRPKSGQRPSHRANVSSQHRDLANVARFTPCPY